MHHNFRFGFCILAVVCLTTTWRTFASDITYVSEAKRASLREEFTAAHAASHLEGAWVCDMYGVRSGMQVKTGVRLYDFSPSAPAFRNSGAQIVQTYKLSENRMLGSSEKVRDELRLSDDGRLLSQLSLASSGAVLVYSVCQR